MTISDYYRKFGDDNRPNTVPAASRYVALARAGRTVNCYHVNRRDSGGTFFAPLSSPIPTIPISSHEYPEPHFITNDSMPYDHLSLITSYRTAFGQHNRQKRSGAPTTNAATALQHQMHPGNHNRATSSRCRQPFTAQSTSFLFTLAIDAHSAPFSPSSPLRTRHFANCGCLFRRRFKPSSSNIIHGQ